MKHFESKQSRLTNLPFIMKWLSAFFLVLALIGFVVGLIMGIKKAGWVPSDIATYYRGSDTTMTFPKTIIELLEVAHFHLMSIPLVFLVVSHLMILSNASNKLKIWLISIGSAGLVLHIITPFLIRYTSSNFAIFKLIGTVSLGMSMLVMTLIEIKELVIKSNQSKGEKKHV
jgi:hypothetical protein